MNQLFEALAHPTRREILELLKKGSMSAGAIAERFDVSKPTLSGHFAKLKDAGMIATASPFLPIPGWAIPVLIIGLTVLMAGVPIIYSYLLWRRERTAGQPSA